MTATVTADKGDAGIKIVSSKLTVTAYGLKGLDAAQFAEVAKEAEGRCPVSNAYRGTMQSRSTRRSRSLRGEARGWGAVVDRPVGFPVPLAFACGLNLRP